MTKVDRIKALQKLSSATGQLVRIKAEYPSAQLALMTILQFYADMAYKSFMSAEGKDDVAIKAHRYQAVHKVLDLLSEVITNPERMNEAFKRNLESLIGDVPDPDSPV